MVENRNEKFLTFTMHKNNLVVDFQVIWKVCNFFSSILWFKMIVSTSVIYMQTHVGAFSYDVKDLKRFLWKNNLRALKSSILKIFVKSLRRHIWTTPTKNSKKNETIVEQIFKREKEQKNRVTKLLQMNVKR